MITSKNEHSGNELVWGSSYIFSVTWNCIFQKLIFIKIHPYFTQYKLSNILPLSGLRRDHQLNILQVISSSLSNIEINKYWDNICSENGYEEKILCIEFQDTKLYGKGGFERW